MTRKVTARRAVLAAERRFKRAKIYFGHGTDNARDEAVFLVFHALGLAFEVSDAILDAPLTEPQVSAVETLIATRIRERRPAAYLTRRMWFAGHEFYVDENVLVPRSPIAELILDKFQPWLGRVAPTRILDIGTGSGCIAIAAALAFPAARIDATDISPGALQVATRNIECHALGARVQVFEADLFPPAEGAVYDLIVANPPYVPPAERAALPTEYRHEPPGALFAEDDGLALVTRILANAARYLQPHGILVIDTGGTWPAVAAAFPQLDFTWVALRNGGDGIGVLTQRQLQDF